MLAARQPELLEPTIGITQTARFENLAVAHWLGRHLVRVTTGRHGRTKAVRRDRQYYR